ncbi:MAG: YfiR family protein [Ramlibacter sp.]|nr:YfiR family protein [Ramlibacter sp.]
MAHLIAVGREGPAPGTRTLRRLGLLLLLLLMWFPTDKAAAQPVADESQAERRVKAAYLYRFAGYVEWPEGAFAGPGAALVIGVWGDDELAADLTTLVAGRTVDGRRIEVREFDDTDPPSGLHILFVSAEHGARLAELGRGARLHGTLVVTESPGALRQGSAINLVMSEGQIRFEVSPEAATRRGLKLSSRLIAVSTNFTPRER